MLAFSCFIFYVMAGYMYYKDLKKEAKKIRRQLRRLGTRKTDSSKVVPTAKQEKAKSSVQGESLSSAPNLKNWK